MFSAAGLKQTWPTLREWPVSFKTGCTSAGSSASVNRVKSLGTSQIITLPSSEAEATMRSLKGFLHPRLEVALFGRERRGRVRTSRYRGQPRCVRGTRE